MATVRSDGKNPPTRIRACQFRPDTDRLTLTHRAAVSSLSYATIAVCFHASTSWAVSDACFARAGAIYGVSPQLLKAIARVESSHQPAAMNLSHTARTGTYDIGLMQINSSHLSKGRVLVRSGLSEHDLKDGCVNAHVGAWLLADLFRRHGVSWDTVGRYNAACTTLTPAECLTARATYTWKVYRAMTSPHAKAR